MTKGVKIGLAIIVVLLLLAVGFVVAVGYALQMNMDRVHWDYCKSEYRVHQRVDENCEVFRDSLLSYDWENA